MKSLRLWVTAMCCFYASAVTGAEAVIAVASNFMETARILAERYHAKSGHRLRISSGSTGTLYAQIRNGAPFDAFLAANDTEPARLSAEGGGAGAPFTYALGRLVLWSSDARRIDDDCATILKRDDYRRLAIANPRLAPYGAAAIAVLDRLGLREHVKSRLVTGGNVAQTFQFVATGNAELGVVARAQTLELPSERKGSLCEIDPALYPPIRQQAILLKHGAGNAAAEGFLKYLRESEAVDIMKRAGYAVVE